MSERILVLPWLDPIVEAHGFDPRSSYVETFWLSVLGPSATWFLRRTAAELELSPEGFELDLAEASRALGLRGSGGSSSSFGRTVARCVAFGLAWRGFSALAVRRKVPPLSRERVARLPASLQAQHDLWRVTPRHEPSVPGNDSRALARRLARGLAKLGASAEEVERDLFRAGVHPALACEAAASAVSDQEPPSDVRVSTNRGSRGSLQFETSSMRVLVPKPVPPLHRYPASSSLRAGPATSR